jgi:hypothetical protein
MNVHTVPTGHICTMEGELGKKLEFLSMNCKEVHICPTFIK